MKSFQQSYFGGREGGQGRNLTSFRAKYVKANSGISNVNGKEKTCSSADASQTI